VKTERSRHEKVRVPAFQKVNYPSEVDGIELSQVHSDVYFPSFPVQERILLKLVVVDVTVNVPFSNVQRIMGKDELNFPVAYF